MYYELYIDVLFLENFLMDYILLLITKHVLCSREPVWRICLAALAGALATCVVVAVRIPYTFIKYGLFYLIIPGIMLIVGLRIRKGPELARGMITLYIGGFLTGGIFSFSRTVCTGWKSVLCTCGSELLSGFRGAENVITVISFWRDPL